MIHSNDWHLLEKEKVADALDTDLYKGLTEHEVRRRRRITGPNNIWHITPIKKKNNKRAFTLVDYVKASRIGSREAEKEIKDRRSEVQRQERRIQQKEETLDRKIENLERKDETLQNKIKAAETRLEEAEKVKQSQFEMLEKISGFTAEQAKEFLLTNLEGELTHEKAVRISQFEQQFKEESEQKALKSV